MLTSESACGYLVKYAKEIQIISSVTDIPEYIITTYPDKSTCFVNGEKYWKYSSCEHSYTEELTYDDQNHWHACTNCGGKKDIAAHRFDSTCDDVCNDCGYVRTDAHHYESTWKNDGSQHWHACTNCGGKKDVADHRFDNTCDDVCNDCGYVRTVIHTYGSAWKNDSSQHWRECSVCGDLKDVADHRFDNTCDDVCNDCGYVRTVIHTYGFAWKNDGNQHWHECSDCGRKKDIAAHRFDNACDTTCNICELERATHHVYDNNLDVSCNNCGYTRNSYTVKYNGNGMSGAPTTQTKIEDISLTLPGMNAYGYRFLGWSKTENGNVDYLAGEQYTKNESILLYAQWARNCGSCDGDGSVSEYRTDADCGTCDGYGTVYSSWERCVVCFSTNVGGRYYGNPPKYVAWCYSCDDATGVWYKNKCFQCGGTGTYPGYVDVDCSSCTGRGYEYMPQIQAPAPTLESKTPTSITLQYVEGADYSLGGIYWQENNVFDGLAPGTTYTFYMRYRANSIHTIGEAGPGLVITVKVCVNEEHSYDDSCDDTCNDCGYVRTDIHLYGSVWKNDENQHWHECSTCGGKKDVADHQFDNACDKDCDICGKIRIVQSDHTFNEQKVCIFCGYAQSFTVTFKNWDGTVLSVKTYHYGDKVTVPANPTKAADKTYTYTFKGWDKTVVNCAGNATYTATYTSSYINYTVTFKDWDGTVLSTKTYHYGDKVTVPVNPTRTADNTYTYAFKGWNKTVVNCAGNATYTAQYTATYKNYTIVFKNWDGSVLSTKTYHWGDTVTEPATPTKPADNAHTYAFAGWDKEVVNCAGNSTYTATFASTNLKYTIVFKNWDGTVLSTKTYRYGDRVTALTNPTRIADSTYTYTFKGWDKTVVACAGDATYTATYTSTYIDYTVVFKNWDGNVLSTKTYHYGDKITAPSNPTRAADNTYNYTFKGWDKTVVNCTGNTTYTATYTSAYINYTVTFKDWNGEVLSTKTYHYSDTVTVPADPVRPDDDTYTYTFTGWDKTVSPSCDGNAVYTAIYSSVSRVPSAITSPNYAISNGTISKIAIGTKVSDLLGKINESQYVKVYNGNKEVSGSSLIGTGMVVKIMDGNTAKASYTVIVTGDTNGDGKLTVTDFVQMQAHLLNKTPLQGAAAKAADISGDGKISVTDYVQMQAHILGKSIVQPQSSASGAQKSIDHTNVTGPDKTAETVETVETVVVTTVVNPVSTDALIPGKKLLMVV